MTIWVGPAPPPSLSVHTAWGGRRQVSLCFLLQFKTPFTPPRLIPLRLSLICLLCSSLSPLLPPSYLPSLHLSVNCSLLFPHNCGMCPPQGMLGWDGGGLCLRRPHHKLTLSRRVGNGDPRAGRSVLFRSLWATRPLLREWSCLSLSLSNSLCVCLSVCRSVGLPLSFHLSISVFLSQHCCLFHWLYVGW